MKFERTKPSGSLNIKNNKSIKGSIVGVFPENILNLKFDPEAMVKPKTMKDFSLVLDEALSIANQLNSDMDKLTGRIARVSFSVNGHRFYQFMDKKDNAHIEFLSKEIKEEILSENRLAKVDDIVEIFTIDGNYLKFKNRFNKVVGGLHLKEIGSKMLWVFESELPNVNYTFTCSNDSPYDCEREVIKWLIENNLFDEMVNKSV